MSVRLPARARAGAAPVGSVLLATGAATAGVALTATSGWLVVRASERPVILTLLTAVVAVRAFGLARPVLRYAERLRSHDAALGRLATARADVAHRLVPLTPARLGRRRRSDLLGGVVDDLTDVVEAPVRATVPVATALVTIALTAGLTALVAPAVAFVHVALLLVVVAVLRGALVAERRGQADLEAARAEVLRVADLVGSRRTDLLAVGAGPQALRWLEDAQSAWAAALGRQSRSRATAHGVLLASVGLATVAAAAVVVRGTEVVPAVAALLVLTPVALGDALSPLADAVRARARADAAAGRLDHLLDQQPAVAPSTTGGPSRLDRVAGVELRLDAVEASWGEHADLGPLDLVLPAGSRTLVTGPNGCGKSTLLAVLARHLDPAAGRYLVDGTDVRDLPLEALCRLVAVVDDEPWVLATTLRDNLRIARPQPEPLPEEDVDAVLLDGIGRAGLCPWFDTLEEGLDTRLGTGGRGVSGGERTRLSIARALVSERPVLLVDEPVAHLDHATATAVLQELGRAAAGRTLVVVSHEGLPDGVVDRVVELAAPPHRPRPAQPAGSGRHAVGA